MTRRHCTVGSAMLLSVVNASMNDLLKMNARVSGSDIVSQFGDFSRPIILGMFC